MTGGGPDLDRSRLVIKVKEPQPSEWPLLRPGHVLFTYFHFAADLELTRAVIDSGITAIAYETLRDRAGGLPLLTPMSEVAGRMSIQEGAKYLERPQEGRGILLSGVPGVAPADVAILGGGVVGSNAAKVAAGLGANVSILDINLDRLRYLDDIMPPNVTTLYSDRHTIVESIERADLVIGAILITGARAPRLLRRDDLARMKNGAVIVDVAIDQGGCVETSRPTTHRQPTYLVDGSGALLRDQYARRGRANQHLRIMQRHIALRAATGKTRLAEPGRRRPGNRRRRQHRPGSGDQPGGCLRRLAYLFIRSVGGRRRWPCLHRAVDVDRDIHDPIWPK